MSGEGGDVLLMTRREPFGNEQFDGCTEYGHRIVTEYPLGPTIEQHYALLRVDRDDSFLGDVQDVGEPHSADRTGTVGLSELARRIPLESPGQG